MARSKNTSDALYANIVSRAKNVVVESKMERCPCYGMSQGMFVALMKDKSDRALAAFERRVSFLGGRM